MKANSELLETVPDIRFILQTFKNYTGKYYQHRLNFKRCRRGNYPQISIL